MSGQRFARARPWHGRMVIWARLVRTRPLKAKKSERKTAKKSSRLFDNIRERLGRTTTRDTACTNPDEVAGRPSPAVRLERKIGKGKCWRGIACRVFILCGSS